MLKNATRQRHHRNISRFSGVIGPKMMYPDLAMPTILA